jgi:hypothetical protein
MKSGTVKWPNFRRYGASRRARRTYPPVQPMRYMPPAYPIKLMRPAMEMNEAALIQSAAVAIPFATAGTPRPAT